MSKCEERAFFVCIGYGGVIGCVVVRFVLSVTEHQSLWGTENCNEKKNWKIIFSVEYVNV